MYKQQSVTRPTVHQVQKPVQSVAAASKAQPTIQPASQATRQVNRFTYQYLDYFLLLPRYCFQQEYYPP